ncbi:MAG: MarR family transcriptional regulator [Actinomycetota bacterium]
MSRAGSIDGFLDGYLPYLLRRADQTLSAPFYETLTRYGVARSEWRVLAVLAELGELSVVDLADAALSPQPTVTHALRRLEARGLVTRTQASDDKRRRIISITDTGSALTATLIAHATELEADALATAGDLTDLVEHLRAVTAAVETRIEASAGEHTTQAG